jgi:hypothetical protein
MTEASYLGERMEKSDFVRQDRVDYKEDRMEQSSVEVS